MMDELSNHEPSDRRSFLSATTVAMGSGLVASYGTFATMAGSFLHSTDSVLGWQFVARVEDIAQGVALTYTSPSGAKVVVARQQEGDSADAFIALSSVCPHLGCQVHWESHNSRFFCPCHNGVFDPAGQPTEGPPAAANQPLTRFPLMVEDGLLFIEVPLVSVTKVACREESSGPNAEEIA